MRKVYFVLSALMLAAVVLQMYLAAVGAFDKPQDDDSYNMHSMNGMMVIPTLSILATIVGAIARVGGKQLGLTILPVGLVALQLLINAIGGHGDEVATTGGRAILGLHALNGMFIMLIAGIVVRRARRLMREGSSAPAKARVEAETSSSLAS